MFELKSNHNLKRRWCLENAVFYSWTLMHVKLNDVFFKTVDELTSPVKMLKVDAQNASAYPFRQTGMILYIYMC